jgi:hypothetical protein
MDVEVHDLHQPQEQNFYAIQQSKGTVMDYAENIINIDHLRKKAHQALLMKDWKKAVDLADEIVAASNGIRGYCLTQLEKAEHANI